MGDTNRGPLTTTFVAPASCSALAQSNYVLVTEGGEWLAQGPINLGDCYPSGYSSQPGEYYSPGLCPSGWAPATLRSDVSTIDGETTYTCCPTKFSYTASFSDHPGWGGCFYDLPQDRSWTISSLYSVSDATTVFLDATTGLAGAINANSIQVRFRAGDFPTTTTTTTAATGDAAASSTAEAASTRTPTSTNGAAADDAGLSTAAQAGIGIGAALGGIAVLAAAALLFRRRHRKRFPRSRAQRLDDHPAGAGELSAVDRKSPAVYGGPYPQPNAYRSQPDAYGPIPVMADAEEDEASAKFSAPEMRRATASSRELPGSGAQPSELGTGLEFRAELDGGGWAR
ncbi:hypothetical protein F4780DRAFT_798180 [Xylariomycetidae sp. FL0641]|nr:hypothetical protein F4780DRAFT_798180 [Xylariomycetidae sp. FL0641]